MNQRLGSSSLFALKLTSLQAVYTSHLDVFMGSLGCVWTHAETPENHWQCEWTKIKWSQDKSRDTLSVYFPESWCESG